MFNKVNFVECHGELDNTLFIKTGYKITIFTISA